MMEATEKLAAQVGTRSACEVLGVPRSSLYEQRRRWRHPTPELKGPATWTYFYLYVIIDIFSRYVVGWMAAEKENSAHAIRLIRETCDKEGIAPGEFLSNLQTFKPSNGERSEPRVVDESPWDGL